MTHIKKEMDYTKQQVDCIKWKNIILTFKCQKNIKTTKSAPTRFINKARQNKMANIARKNQKTHVNKTK